MFVDLYRVLFHASVWIEESLIKGVVFSLPFSLLSSTPRQLFKTTGITAKNFLSSVAVGILLGVLLGAVGQGGSLIKYGRFIAPSVFPLPGMVGAYLILALITAFWEQLFCVGYILPLLTQWQRHETVCVAITGIVFSLIHIPSLVFIQHQTLPQLVSTAVLFWLLGSGCAVLKLRQQNLIAPIMAQALWGVTLYMFR